MYRIKAACVVATVGGVRRECYPPAMLPDDIPQAEIDHFLDSGLIEEVEDLAAPIPADAVGWPAPTPDAAGSSGDTTSGSARPSQAAPKAAWVDYATTQGATREDADGMSKADLVEKYGR